MVSFADYYFVCGSDDRFRTRPIVRARELAARFGRPTLVDLRAGAATNPTAFVPVRSQAGSWVALPVYFTVEPGDTLADLLAREGDRGYYDVEADETYTLRELLALANVPPTQPAGSTTEALLPLEGLRLNVTDLRVVRATVTDLLDERGVQRWDREHVGSIAGAANLPATDLQGVGTTSTLGKALADRSVGEVAAEDQEQFIERVLANIAPRQRVAMERQARDVWLRASRIARLGREWVRG